MLVNMSGRADGPKKKKTKEATQGSVAPITAPHVAKKQIPTLESATLITGLGEIAPLSEQTVWVMLNYAISPLNVIPALAI